MSKLTYLKALKISYKMALWIFKRPSLDKPFSPYYRKVVYLPNQCTLCAVDTGCDYCIGKPVSVERGCFNNAVRNFNWSHDTTYRKICMGYIASKLRREIKRQEEKELSEIRKRTKRNLYETMFVVQSSNYPIWMKRIALRIISWVEKYV